MLKKESEFLKCPNDRICLTSVLLQIVMIKFIKNRTFVYHEDFLSLSHVSKNSNISNKFKALFSHRKIPTIYFHNNCKSGHVPTSNSIYMHVSTSHFSHPPESHQKKKKKTLKAGITHANRYTNISVNISTPIKLPIAQPHAQLETNTATREVSKVESF